MWLETLPVHLLGKWAQRIGVLVSPAEVVWEKANFNQRTWWRYGTERKRSAGTQLLALATDKTTLVSALLQKQLLMPATMSHAQIAYQYSTGRQSRRGSVPRLLHIPESHANNAAPLHTRRYSSPVLSLFLRPQFALPHTAAIIVLGAGHGRLSSKPQPRLDEAT